MTGLRRRPVMHGQAGTRSEDVAASFVKFSGQRAEFPQRAQFKSHSVCRGPKTLEKERVSGRPRRGQEPDPDQPGISLSLIFQCGRALHDARQLE